VIGGEVLAGLVEDVVMMRDSCRRVGGGGGEVVPIEFSKGSGLSLSYKFLVKLELSVIGVPSRRIESDRE
jgi:hypothetical protein